MKEIHVVITMDCEPITTMTHGSSTGPSTWDLGERAVRGYGAIGKAFGFPITYFIHPETASEQAALFVELEQGHGACLGLHMHPWKYSMSTHNGRKYLEHYGGLTEEQQRELITEASATWVNAIGRHPTYFRPGTFSANDAVFKVLNELGFRGGSCSLPGRMMPEMRAAWVGAIPDPHRGHESFRLAEGSLDFVNMPLSTDFSRALKGKLGATFHPDLRPDIDWMKEYQLTYYDIATSIVEQLLQRKPTVPCINLVSHNHFDYSNPLDPAAARLRQAMEAIQTACDAQNIQAVGATMADITAKVLAMPAPSDQLVCEGTLYGSGQVGRLGSSK